MLRRNESSWPYNRANKDGGSLLVMFPLNMKLAALEVFRRTQSGVQSKM